MKGAFLEGPKQDSVRGSGSVLKLFPSYIPSVKVVTFHGILEFAKSATSIRVLVYIEGG